MAEAYKKRKTKKEYDGTYTDDAFNFKISEADFKDREEAVAFLTNVYKQSNISNYIKGAVIVNFRREQEGYGFEEIEEALSFQKKLKDKNQLGAFKRLMSYIELYGLEDITTMIENKGKIKEEEIAKNIGEQVIQYLKQNVPLQSMMVNPMAFNLPSETAVVEEEKEDKPKKASVVDFEDDDEEDEEDE